MKLKSKIKFKGTISKQSMKFLKKEQVKAGIMVSIIGLILTVPIIIIAAIYLEILILIFLFAPIALAILFPLSPLYDPNPPKEIIFEDDGMVYIICEKFYKSREIADIKKIIDFGEGYYIKFYFPSHCLFCLCQKNLIEEGSVEIFEDNFKDYIVKQ